MIRLEELTIGYGDRLLIEACCAEIRPGRLTALVGRNGTGKSTLLRTIAGLGTPLSGRIFIGGHPLNTLSPRELAEEVAFVTTERMRIADLRVKDLVALGRSPYTNWIGRLAEADRQIVEQSLLSVGLAGYEERTLDRLSDGECQRAMIARALAQQTPVILLDEPTSALDPELTGEVLRVIRGLKDKNTTMIVVTHEMEFARGVADKVIYMADGVIEEEGTPEEVFGNPKSPILQGFLHKSESI